MAQINAVLSCILKTFELYLFNRSNHIFYKID